MGGAWQWVGTRGMGRTKNVGATPPTPNASTEDVGGAQGQLPAGQRLDRPLPGWIPCSSAGLFHLLRTPQNPGVPGEASGGPNP